MASTKMGEMTSGPLSEVIGAESLRNTHSEADELIPWTKNEVDESMSSVNGDQAPSCQTQSLSGDKSQNEKGEHKENGGPSGKDLEDAPSLENLKCEQDSIDNGRETATDKTSSENQHEHQESPTPSGPDQSKSSQQRGLNSTMHADRLQNQRDLQVRVPDTINQVEAASNELFEVPDPRGPSGPTRGGIDYALQDYQMQLMLLEQSNKRRLWMARQEQDGVGETNSDDKPEKSTVPADSAPQELPDTTVETRSCAGSDSSASGSFKAHL